MKFNRNSEISPNTKRGFQGIWIPKEIWLDKKLSIIEKVFLAEIRSLDNEEGCTASNKYFAEFFGITPKRASAIICGLVKKNLINSTITYVGKTSEVHKRYLNVLLINQAQNTMKGEGIPKNEDTLPYLKGEGIPENRDYITKSDTISIDKEKKKKSNPIEKSETLFIDDERLVDLQKEFETFNCTFPNANSILRQAKKYFISETDDEIITTFIDYWKKYKPNSGWNSGAWFYKEFLMRAYEFHKNRIVAEKIEKERVKTNASQRIKTDKEGNIKYQKDLELQTMALSKFYSLPRKPQLNLIAKFNNDHKSNIGINLKNKIITGENPVKVIWFKNYLVTDLLSPQSTKE